MHAYWGRKFRAIANAREKCIENYISQCLEVGESSISVQGPKISMKGLTIRPIRLDNDTSADHEEIQIVRYSLEAELRYNNSYIRYWFTAPVSDIPCMFLKFTSIEDLYMEDCILLDAALCRDCIVYLTKLKVLNISGCYQLNQYSLLQMLSRLPTLQILHARGTGKLIYSQAYTIMTSCHAFKFVDFDMANVEVEKYEWRNLIQLTCMYVEFSQEMVSTVVSAFLDNNLWP